MARTVIVIEDGVGPNGEEGVNIEIESQDPSLPLKDGTLDFEAATPSQNIAFGAIMEIAGLAKTLELLTREGS